MTAADVAWFPTLVREFPKPMPFVPVIDNDLLRWWGQDQLWQSEDARYSADSVRIIPGPISVAGITTMDEPIADILGRFEHAAVERVKEANNGETTEAFAELGACADAEAFIRSCPNISWVGHLMANPAYGTANGDANYEIRHVGTGEDGELFDLDIHLDTYWDNDPDGGLSKHAVRDIVIPLVVNGAESGLFPVVDRDRLPEHVYAMLAATAGIGNTAITGDELTAMPVIEKPAPTRPPARSARRTPPTPCPPTSDSTTRPPPPAPCRRTSRPRASPPTRWSARPGPPSTRRSAPCTSTASRSSKACSTPCTSTTSSSSRSPRRSCSPTPARPSA